MSARPIAKVKRSGVIGASLGGGGGGGEPCKGHRRN